MLRIVLLLMLCAACRLPAEEKPAAAKGEHNIKGWDIRSWKNDKGEWVFSFLPGTNRLKSVEEIREAAVVGLDALKEKIAALREGERVDWQHTAVQIAGKMNLEFPPADTIDAIKKYCTERKLMFETSYVRPDEK